jgi:hypothetical protein
MPNDISIRITADANSATRGFEAVDRSLDKTARKARETAAEITRLNRTLNQPRDAAGRFIGGARPGAPVVGPSPFPAATGGPLPVGGSRFGGLGAGFAGGVAAGAAGFAIGEAQQFGRESLQAAIAASRSMTFLENSARRAGLAIADQRREVQNLRRDYALSETDAERALAGAIRAARIGGNAGQGSALLRSTLNLAAGAGIERGRVPDLIGQIARGEDEAFDLLLGRGPSSLYREAAQRTGRRESSFTDFEKAQIRINAVISEGNRELEANARYIDSVAGRYDRLAAAIADVQRATGNAILSRGGIAAIATALVPAVAPFAIQQALRPEPSGGAGLFSDATAAIGNVGAQGLGLFRRLQREQAERRAADYQESLRQGRVLGEVQRDAALRFDRSPFADIRREYAARAARIESDNTVDGRFTSFGARLLGLSAAEEQRAIAERTGDVRFGLGQQAFGIRSRYGAAISPAAQAIAEAQSERLRLVRETANLGGEFGAERAALLLEQARSASFGLGVAGANNLSAAANIEGRIAQLQARTRVTGYRRGRYGQVTGEAIFGTAYGESADEQIARIFRTSGDIRNRLSTSLAGPFDASEASAISGRLERQYLLSSLAQFRPEEFTGDQRRLYEEALRQAREDELQQAADTLKAQREIANTVKSIDRRLAGEEPLEISTNVNLEDRAEGADFRFKNRLFQTGDTLSNQF